MLLTAINASSGYVRATDNARIRCSRAYGKGSSSVYAPPKARSSAASDGHVSHMGPDEDEESEVAPLVRGSGLDSFFSQIENVRSRPLQYKLE